MDARLGKLRDQADDWLRKGKLDRALGAYTQVAQADPDNPRWSLKTGEIHRKLGHTPQAVQAFRHAARRLADQGFTLKAIAVCNQILAIEPRHAETHAMLASFQGSQPAETPAPPHTATPVSPSVAGATPASPSVAAAASVTAATEALPSAATVTPTPPSATAAPLSATTSTEAPAVQETSASAPAERGQRKTLPPGARLDSVSLRALALAEHGPLAAPALAPGVVEIPLDAELDAAFAEAVALDTRPGPRIPPIPLFSSLNVEALRALVERATVQVFLPGESIVRQGESGDTLFVIVEGEVIVYNEGPPRVELARLSEGAFFGEIALITHFPRTSTVEAADETTLLEISTEVIGSVIDEHPTVLKVLLRFFRNRLVNSLLETSELFVSFPPAERASLAERFAFLESDPGTTLQSERQGADGLYVLLCGQLAVSHASHETVVLGPGDIFGQTALLGDDHDPPTVTTQTKCWLLKLDRRAFHEVIVTYPHVLAYLSELADRRLLSTREDRGLELV